jgi:Gpi18-like mannosyltransferase
MKSQHKTLVIIPILLISLFANVAVISLAFHVSWDVYVQEGWGDYLLAHGVRSLYAANATDYPPLYLYALYFNAWLNHQISIDKRESHPPKSFQYVLISKMLPLFCNLLVGLILFFTLKKGNLRKATVAASLYLFNPAIIYNTAYWGQVDSVYTAFLFLSAIFLIKRKYLLSTLFASVAILTKIQALVFLPILGVILLMNLSAKRLVRLILADLVFVAVILLPFVGVARSIVSTLIWAFGSYPYVTVGALNTWYLFFSYPMPDYSKGMLDSVTILGISLRMIGYVAIGIYTALVLYQILRAHLSIELGSASLAFASFMLLTEIHERYLFPFFALFLLTALEKRKYVGIYAILTMTYLLNMVLVMDYGQFSVVFYSIKMHLTLIAHYWSMNNLAVVIAGLNTVVFVYYSTVAISSSLTSSVRHDISLIGRRLSTFLRNKPLLEPCNYRHNSRSPSPGKSHSNPQT